MSRNLSEDEIRIIDNRGRYSIRKWVLWVVVGIILLSGTAAGLKIVRQARFISELTSGKVSDKETFNVSTMDKIHVIEVNGAKTNLTIGEWNLHTLYSALQFVPKSFSSNPYKELKDAWKVFSKNVEAGAKEFRCYGINVKVDYQDGKAYRYYFHNPLNDYSMMVVCNFDNLKKQLDKIIR